MLFTGTTCLKDTNNTNNNTQNKLKLMMKTKFFYSKVMLLMLAMVLSAQGLWAQKSTPTMELSPLDGSGYLDNEYKEVYPQWGSFAVPTVALYTGTSENRTPVLSKYQITYYIDGKENLTSFESDANGRQYTEDATGTTITRFYGDVKVGDKTGTVTIRVVAKVKEAYKDSYAESVSATYKFNIIKVTPGATSVSPAALQIGVWHTETHYTGLVDGDPNYYKNNKWDYSNTSAMVPVPTPSVSITKNGHVQDLLKVYDVTFSPKAGSESLLEVKNDGASKGIGADNYIVAKLTDAQKASGSNGEDDVQDPYKTSTAATLLATFTPKASFADAYNEVTVEIPVTIQDFDKSNKFTASLTLEGVTTSTNKDVEKTEANTILWSRWNDRTAANEGTAKHHMPKPTVIGSNGADLSKNSQLSICYFAVEDNTEYDDCQKNEMNPWGEVWAENETTDTGSGPTRAKNLGYRLNGSEYLYESNKPGLVKVGAFVYLHDDGGKPDASNSSSLDNWYQFTDENTIGLNSPYTQNSDYSTEFRRITPIQYFYINVIKRVPELVFNPDPTGVHYSTADKINMNNRFELSGAIDDSNDGTAGTLTYGPQWGAGDDTFWYTFEFDADAGIVVNNWPHGDRVYALDNEGNKIEPLGYDWDNNGLPTYVVYNKKKGTDEWGNEIEVDDTESIATYTASDADVIAGKANVGDPKDKRSQIKSWRYWSVKGFGTDDLWTIQFTTPGSKNITYTIHPFNHARWDVGVKKTQTYIIDAAKQTKLNIDPKELVASVSQAGFVEPEVWVTDVFGTEVSSDYSFSYEILSDPSETSTTVTDDGGDGTGPKHEITIGNKVGDVTVKVTATTTNAKYDEGCHTLTGEYTIHILNTNEDTDPLYEIISSKDAGAQRNSGNTGTTEYDYAKDKVMGKMHFIKAGKFYAGYTISGVPGIDIRFGVFDGSTWTVKEDPTEAIGSYDNANDINGGITGQHIKFIGDDTPVELDANGIAKGGHFYEFYSHTNGFLTIDARWEAKHTYVLIDYDYPNIKYEYTPDTEVKGEYTFPMAMIEDHSYHLYCTTGGQINMHGFSFEPAFINNRYDTAPVTTGSAFLNNFLDVPTLAVASIPTVTYSIDESDVNKAAATLNSSTGKVTPVALTFANTPNYVTIHGKVVSQVGALAEKVYKIPYYNLVIADIPTYRLGDGLDAGGKDALTIVENDTTGVYVPDPGTVVTTYNIPTPIRMTYGGWSNKYTSASKERQDGYKTKGNAEIAGFTSTDTQFNRYIDGFTWSNVAAENPSDENGSQNYKNYLTGAGNMRNVDGYYKDTFTLPAHGAYWRFEPQTSGFLFVYLVQNGICSYTGDPHSLQNTSKNYQGLDWKPLYIVDETGEPVSTDVSFDGMNESVKDFLGSDGTFTKGIIRCSKTDANIKKVTNADPAQNDGTVFAWTFIKNDKEAGFDVDYGGSNPNKATLHGIISNSWGATGDSQDIFQDPESNGYSLISKAYVRYAIRVKAGKSYWVFQNASKPNLCGFGFVPDGFNGAPENNNGPAAKSVTINDSEDLSASLAKVGGLANIKDVPTNVTYDGRTFKNRQWTSLCLPFAVSEYNFHQVFGENAKIVAFENLNEEKTNIHFVQHNYRMMEAGRPYFVYPDWGEGVTDKTSLIFNGVTFEGKAEANDYNDNDKKIRIKEDKGLQFVGTYDGETMPMYSYFVSAADGKLKRVGADKPSGMACKRYRAYLKNPNSDVSLSKIGSTAYEEPYEDVPAEEQGQTTKIIGISDANVYDAVDGSALKNGIYNLSGQQISTNGKNINNLPAGTYIINGKKKIIR